jgi:hypothetical protein
MGAGDLGDLVGDVHDGVHIEEDSTFWHTQARRSRPMPVSMFFWVSSV